MSENNENVDKIVYILRGVSGSGKSTLANELIKNRNGIICCADDFFMKNGEYQFDINKLGQAHDYSKSRFLSAILDPLIDVVVVANTNINIKDINEYKKIMDLYKDKITNVFYLVIENRHGGKDIHNVPEHVLSSQEERLRNSLSLR